jgi:hypothetical protein
MARDYNISTMGQAFVAYQSWGGKDADGRLTGLRQAQVNLPAMPEPLSVVVVTCDERGTVLRQHCPSLEAAHFKARVFVEWDGGDAAFVVQQ